MDDELIHCSTPECDAERLSTKQHKVVQWLRLHDFEEYVEKFLSYGFDDLLVLASLDIAERDALYDCIFEDDVCRVGHQMKLQQILQNLAKCPAEPELAVELQLKENQIGSLQSILQTKEQELKEKDRLFEMERNFHSFEVEKIRAELRAKTKEIYLHHKARYGSSRKMLKTLIRAEQETPVIPPTGRGLETIDDANAPILTTVKTLPSMLTQRIRSPLHRSVSHHTAPPPPPRRKSRSKAQSLIRNVLSQERDTEQYFFDTEPPRHHNCSFEELHTKFNPNDTKTHVDTKSLKLIDYFSAPFKHVCRVIKRRRKQSHKKDLSSHASKQCILTLTDFATLSYFQPQKKGGMLMGVINVFDITCILNTSGITTRNHFQEKEVKHSPQPQAPTPPPRTRGSSLEYNLFRRSQLNSGNPKPPGSPKPSGRNKPSGSPRATHRRAATSEAPLVSLKTILSPDELKSCSISDEEPSPPKTLPRRFSQPYITPKSNQQLFDNMRVSTTSFYSNTSTKHSRTLTPRHISTPKHVRTNSYHNQVDDSVPFLEKLPSDSERKIVWSVGIETKTNEFIFEVRKEETVSDIYRKLVAIKNRCNLMHSRYFSASSSNSSQLVAVLAGSSAEMRSSKINDHVQKTLRDIDTWTNTYKLKPTRQVVQDIPYNRLQNQLRKSTPENARLRHGSMGQSRQPLKLQSTTAL